MSDEVKRLLDEGWERKTVQAYCDYAAKFTRRSESGRQCSTQDSQRLKVYRAEWKFKPLVKDQIKNFANEREAHAFLKRVVKSKLWATLCGGDARVPDLVFSNNMRRTLGLAWYSQIKLCSKSGMNSYVLLHELAHVCGNMHHDVQFRKDHVRLVSRFMGTEAAKLLKKCYKEQGLKMSIRTKMKTPEQWLEGYNRLAAARKKIAA